jgi:hypothetical protein
MRSRAFSWVLTALLGFSLVMGQAATASTQNQQTAKEKEMDEKRHEAADRIINKMMDEGASKTDIEIQMQTNKKMFGYEGEYKENRGYRSSPPPPPPPPTSGWHRPPPTINTSPLPKNNNCYFDYGIMMSNGMTTGTQSWKEAGCTKNKGGCSGTYTGEVTWTVPPAFLKPGSAIPFKVTAKTVAKNTCGSLNIGSWVAMKSGGPQAFVTMSDAVAPGKLMEAKATWTVPKGQPNQKIIFEVLVQAANLSGRATYTYVYK